MFISVYCLYFLLFLTLHQNNNNQLIFKEYGRYFD